MPHWGYVISGQMALEYADGVREVYEAGQVYYQPPGHSGARAAAGTEIIEFSPEPEYTRLIDTFKGMMRG